MELTACPHQGCDSVAEILDRVVLESTDDAVEHVRILCVDGHRFFMPILMLPDRMPTGG